MGLFSEFFSGIGEAIRGLCSAIGGAIEKLATTICIFAEKAVQIGQKLFPEMSKLGIICNIIGGVVSLLAEFLGIKKENEDSPEELGMKAEKADSKIDDFDSTEEYINYLHEKITLDDEEKANISPEQRMAYSSLGSHLYLDASAEKLGVEKGDLTPDVILDCAKGKINANEFTGIVANLKESGLKPQAMSDYLHNSEKISFEDAQKTRSAMYNAFKEIEPELTDEQFADRITEIRDELS